MKDIDNGIKMHPKQIKYLLGVLLTVIVMFTLASCSLWNKEQSEDYSYLKGQHILVVINGFNRNPDVIEDWTDYKRYTWHQCKHTGQSTVGVRNGDSYYLKPEVICCDVQFETDRKNIVFNYKGLDVCPVGTSLKQKSK